jgi:hypothetical protein
MAQRRKKKPKPFYQTIRKPMAPPSQVHASKLRPKTRKKKVDLREVEGEEVEESGEKKSGTD